MPPSGHSSSHHSSSHHSSHSSSHHSSHSSSRSYSSSRSSHSTSHHSSSVIATRNNYRNNAARPHRTRTTQPYGWNTAHGAVGHYYCAAHDYDYYPQAWTAPDGRHFEEGYYDENGQHYDNMIMTGGTTMLKCVYCGNHMVYTWKEGDLPVCDKCGAPLTIDITDKEEIPKPYSSGTGNTGDRGFKTVWSGIPAIGKIAVITFVACMAMPFLVLIAALGIVGISKVRSVGTSNETVSVKNSIYVEEIGRTCYLDGEDWYDSQSDCWFYYNDDVAPYQWQYWYEGISSDYGDYGWMEYDMGEEAWYIEADSDNWVHLPEDYDTSMLWHMTDEYTNPYE